jgi:hypothetical protein
MFDLLDISTFCKISHIYIEVSITNMESIVKWIGRLAIVKSLEIGNWNDANIGHTIGICLDKANNFFLCKTLQKWRSFHVFSQFWPLIIFLKIPWTKDNLLGICHGLMRPYRSPYMFSMVSMYWTIHNFLF